MLILSQFFVSLTSISAQEKKSFKKEKTSKINEATQNIDQAIERGDEVQLAKSYFELGEQYENLQDYQKSESYFLKSKDLYFKLQQKKELADVTRRLARVQELLNNKKDAYTNYNYASEISESDTRKLNEIDAARMQNNMNDSNEEEVLVQKIEQLNAGYSRYSASERTNETNDVKNNTQVELSESYDQLGNVLLQQNKIEPAIENFKNAMINVDDNPIKIMAINDKIMNTYVANNDLNKAINQNIQLLKSDIIKKDPASSVKIKENLSDLYRKQNDEDSSLKLLEESYRLALETGQTLKARDIVTRLGQYYISLGEKQKELELLKEFVSNLDSVMFKDSSMFDMELIKATELRIRQLEEEKILKDSLLKKQNQLNYFLIFGLIVLGIAFFLIYKSLQAVKIRNKKIALQALRKEMNPHFIFNSLNSVNQFIAVNDERTANAYLTRFSSLMRTVMENSNKDFIPLEKEMELINNYLELEHQRFSDKFDYEVRVEKDLDNEVLIPNMLIQPHVENAIWHGLRYKRNKGKLTVSFKKLGKHIQVIIEDDGIGISESQKIKTSNQKAQLSLGTANVKERISLLNLLYNCTITSEVSDRKEESGTIVRLNIPLKIKHKV